MDTTHNKKFELTVDDSKDIALGVQYASIYYCRISKLLPLILENARTTNENLKHCTTQVEETSSEKSILLTGLLSRRYPDSVRMREAGECYDLLDDLDASTRWLSTQVPEAVVLCDTPGEVELLPNSHDIQQQLADIPSGVVLGVEGCVKIEESVRRFLVCSVFEAGVPEPMKGLDRVNAKGTILFLSGLHVRHGMDNTLYSALLRQVSTMVQSGLNQVVIAGGVLGGTTTKDVEEADHFLTNLCSIVPTVLMSGGGDPTGSMLPNPPCSRSLYTNASTRPDRFTRHTNPFTCIVNERCLLGSSGEPLDDILRSLKLDDSRRLQLLAQCVGHRHMAPTAPDTLPCHPFSRRDPFLIEARPDIFFAGNQPYAQSALISGASEVDSPLLVLLIPLFKTSCQSVLVDSASLETTVLSTN